MKIWAKVGVFIGILAGLIAIYQFLSSTTSIDLNGKWLITDTVSNGTYKNSSIAFEVFIIQKDREFTGEGEKTLLNGKIVKKDDKSRLELKYGLINSNKIRAIFIEHGKQRQTRGEFVWFLANKNKLMGSFSSTTSASGSSLAERIE